MGTDLFSIETGTEDSSREEKRQGHQIYRDLARAELTSQKPRLSVKRATQVTKVQKTLTTEEKLKKLRDRYFNLSAVLAN